MKEQNLTEKESLEIISRMIKQTKQNMQIGYGNTLLYYGFTAVIISVVVYLLCHYTSAMAWHNLWFLMFLPMIYVKMSCKKQDASVVTYIDRAVKNVWSVINSLFIFTVATIIVIGFITNVIILIPMMPLSLLYVGIGTACTGVITNEKSMTYLPVISFVISIYMLIYLLANGSFGIEWNLLCGLGFLTMLVIPGHILNRKSLKQCSEN